jgi:hypothetical protein
LLRTPTTLSGMTVIRPGTRSRSAGRKRTRISPALSKRAASSSSRGTDTSTNTFIR